MSQRRYLPADDLPVRHPYYLVVAYPCFAVVAVVRAAAQRPPLFATADWFCRRIFTLALSLGPADEFLLLRPADPLCHRGASAYLGPVSRARQTSPLAHPGARPLGHDCRLWLSWRGHRHVCVLLPHPLRLYHSRVVV